MKRSAGLPPQGQDTDEQRVLQLVARAYPAGNANDDDAVVARAVARLAARWKPRATTRTKLRLSLAMVLVGMISGGALAAVTFHSLWRPPAPPQPPPALAPTRGQPTEVPAPAKPAPTPAAPELPARTAKARPLPPEPVRQRVDAGTDNAAARLFEEARRARGLGWDALAAQRFEQLLNEYPASPEADVSRLAAGRLYRRLGDHAAALRVFSSYVQHNPGGPLEEEAMAGVAHSLESLGQDASLAWQALARAHPQSPYLKRQPATP